jgi:SNF2 family DNA or RNA helicase
MKKKRNMEQEKQTKFEEWLNITGLKREQHQVDAISWCLNRESADEYKGGIIADEMGLGKTIEMIGTMHSNDVEHTLIILPYSLLIQWEKTIVALLGIQPLIYHGVKRNNLTEDNIRMHKIVLTTYGLISDGKRKRLSSNKLQNNEDLDESKVINPLFNIMWDRIVYDEAHHLRNKTTKVNIGANKLTSHITWLMTGTPIQNSVHDLYSLYKLLGFTSKSYIISNIDSLINEYMLRRTKKDAGIILPICHSSVIEVAWQNSKEEELAENIHIKLSFSKLNTLRGLLEENGSTAMITTGNFINISEKETFKLLACAKKICVLPRLMQTTLKRLALERKIDEVINMTEMLRLSSKIERVIKEVLKRKGNGKPKLIFCYFHGEIDEIERILKNHNMDVRTFDGRTSKKERTDILSRTCEVLIGQIDATNEGLNLQTYKEVYIISPHWNPAVEDQAIARCHRMGQTEEVNVFRFMMSGFPGYDKLENAPKAITLDEHVYNMQELKRELARTLFDPVKASVDPVKASVDPAKASVDPVKVNKKNKKKHLIIVD